MRPEDAAVAAEALRQAALALASDVREDATHARAIELLHRRAAAYDRQAGEQGFTDPTTNEGQQ